MACGSQRIRRSSAARDGVVARLLRRFKGLLRFVKRLQRDVGEALVVEGQGAAIRGPQRVERFTVTAEQILADSQPDRGRRTAITHLFQFADRATHVAMGRGVAAEGLSEAADFSGAERSRAGNELANIDGGGGVLYGGDHARSFSLD